MDPNTPVPGGRARARGRSRGQRPPEPARRPTDVPILPPQQPVPPMYQLPSSGAAAAPPSASMGSTEVRPAEASLATAVSSMQQLQIGEASAGRGVVRGRRMAAVALNLRLPACGDKRGSVGEPIKLLTNYIKVESARGKDFIFYQYRVEYAPLVESSKMRRAMLFDHLDKIGRSFIFDGMEDLKTTKRLAQDVWIVVF